MRCGIILTAGDPRAAASMAAEAEAAGWDGVFTWDGIAIGEMDTWDPWVLMAGMAMTTDRVTLGAIVTPPSRRRPWKLAREAVTLDHLSRGRLVLPVGLGATDDGGFGNVGEATDARTRAERLDESLAILDGLWSGEAFGFTGRHYRFEPMVFRPTPIQRPRIPIWVVGAWPSERSIARAARWDGVLLQGLAGGTADGGLRAEDLSRLLAAVRAHRPAALSDRRFDVIASGSTPTTDPEAARSTVARWRDAGATWWIEADWGSPTADQVRRRIEAGPPTPCTGASD